MPYISKREKEEARWMPLTEAVERIQAVDKVRPEQALKQLIAAIEDKEVRARIDGRKISPKDLQVRVSVCLEPPGSMHLNREGVQQSLEIVQGPVNDPENLDALDYNTVTVLRDNLDKYWPLAVLPAPDNAHTRRPPPPSRKIITEVARKLYRENPSNPPNMTKAEVLIRKKLPGATRALIRPVLGNPEFKRRSPGKQPKR